MTVVEFSNNEVMSMNRFFQNLIKLKISMMKVILIFHLKDPLRLKPFEFVIHSISLKNALILKPMVLVLHLSSLRFQLVIQININGKDKDSDDGERKKRYQHQDSKTDKSVEKSIEYFNLKK